MPGLVNLLLKPSYAFVLGQTAICYTVSEKSRANQVFSLSSSPCKEQKDCISVAR